jgi:hypothetical protein
MSVNFPGHGRQRMLVMGIGMQAASATFQSIMDRVLVGLEGFTANYIDDLTIFSDTWEEHLAHVAMVLDRLASAGFPLRPKKCHIGVREVEFLGYVVSADGHRPSPGNTAAIVNLVFPEHPDSMRSWIGLITFYNSCIPWCALLLEPLQARVLARRTGPASPAEREAFHALQKALTDHDGPVLIRPNMADTLLLLAGRRLHAGALSHPACALLCSAPRGGRHGGRLVGPSGQPPCGAFAAQRLPARGLPSGSSLGRGGPDRGSSRGRRRVSSGCAFALPGSLAPASP